jgi:hypothetical protein
VNLSLATNEPAELVLYDIAGRALERQSVNLGMGPHTVTFHVDAGLGQGLYFLRVRQAGRDAATAGALRAVTCRGRRPARPAVAGGTTAAPGAGK